MKGIDRYYFWKRVLSAFILLSIVWYWYSGMMVHHVYDSPFRYKGADLSFWIIEFIGLPQLICSNYATAVFFSLILLLSFVAIFLLPKKRGPVFIGGCLLFLYQVLFNYKLGYHTHHLYGLQFVLLPFYFKKEVFHISWPLARFLACLTYFFAGLFKLVGRGWEMGSFSNTLMNQHAAYFHFYPESWRSQFSLFLIEQPLLAFLFFLMAMLLQLSFFAGLFTRRFDRYFASAILLFHVMDWFLMNLGVFMSMTVLSILFLVDSDLLKPTPSKDSGIA